MTEFAAPPTNTSSYAIPSQSISNANPFTLPSSNGNIASARLPSETSTSLSTHKLNINGIKGIKVNGFPSLKGKERDLTGFKGKTLELLQNPFVWVDFVDPDKEEDDELDQIPEVDLNRKKRKHQEDPEAGPSNSSHSYDGIGPRLPTNGNASLSTTPASDEVLYAQDPRTTRPTNITRERPYGIGLINLGNTCYQNSVIQILMHTPPVMEFLYKHQRRKDCPDYCLACDLKERMNEVWMGRKGRAVSLREMNRNIKKVCPSMRPGRQEDAHEFLRYAIDNLQDANLRSHGKTKASPAVKETTLIHKSFGGKLRSRVRCSVCNYDSDTFDTFMDLSVDISRDAQDLQTCLRRIAQTDRLFGKNKYKCEKCKKLVDAEKTVRIVRLPPILSIHLKRFTATGRKINSEIKYPEQLQMPSSAVDGASAVYELYGVVCHQGSGPHLGHYYSLIKGSDRTWQEMNDESVSKAHHSCRDRNAYILHYVLAQGSKLDSVVNDSAKSAKSVPHSPRPVLNGSSQQEVDIGSPMRPRPIPPPAQAVAGPSNYREHEQTPNQTNNSRKRPAVESDQDEYDQTVQPYHWSGAQQGKPTAKRIKLAVRSPTVAYGPGSNGSRARPDFAPPRSNGDHDLPRNFAGKGSGRGQKRGRGRGGDHGSPYKAGSLNRQQNSGPAHSGGRPQKAKNRMQGKHVL